MGGSRLMVQSNLTTPDPDGSTRYGEIGGQDPSKRPTYSKGANVGKVLEPYRKPWRGISVVQSISPFRPFHVLILGGGISGLVAAYTLTKDIKWPCSISLLEKKNKVGGWIHSDKFSTGSIFERGPKSMRSVGKLGNNTLKLISDIGLEGDIIASNNMNSKRRYIYANGQITELPYSTLGLLKKMAPLPKPLMVQIVKEILLEKSAPDDRSVHEFFESRFGKEVTKYLVDAFCLGIYASRAKNLSVKACFPGLWQNEQDYGSVVLGDLLSPKEDDKNYDHPLCKRSRKEKWPTWSLRNGLETIPLKLADIVKQRSVNLRLSTECASLQLNEKRQWVCTTSENEQIIADHVIATVPSFALGGILKDNFTTLSSLFSSFQWTTVGSVAMEFNKEVLTKPGFGILFPSCENRKILGVVYDSMVFPQQNTTPNATKLTAMLGGDRFETIFGDPQNTDLDMLRDTALEELKDIFGISNKPDNCVAYVNERCIPRYEVGHLDLVKRIKNYIELNNIPLTIAGSSYYGVAVNNIIYDTQEEIRKFIRHVNDQQLRLGLACM